MIPNEKVAGAGADMAADQDVPLQADHHQPGAGAGQPPAARGDARGPHEDVARGDSAEMGQPPAREGEIN